MCPLSKDVTILSFLRKRERETVSRLRPQKSIRKSLKRAVLFSSVDWIAMAEPVKLEVPEGEGRRKSGLPGSSTQVEGKRRQSKLSQYDMSPGRGHRMSTGGGGRATSTSTGGRRGRVQYENTYRTEPMLKFRSDMAHGIIQELFERKLKTVK